MNNKATYRQFCSTQSDLPIFSQDWYLDAVCEGGDWEVIIIEKGGQIAATLPYFLKCKGPFSYVTMPHLTKFLGPHIIARYRATKHEAKLIQQLIEQLPSLAYFRQNLHYRYTNWLPFYWKSFQQQTAYSYHLSPLNDLTQVYNNIQADYRRQKIAKAETEFDLQLKTDLAIQDFHQVAAQSYQRQKLDFPVSISFLEKLAQATTKHQSGQCFFAVDQEGYIHSAAFLLWDQEAAYLLMIGDDPNYRSSGAGIWLVWQLIQYTSQTLGLNTFDFLGSMIQPIERVRRQFGARQVAYSSVWQYGAWWWKALDTLRR